jgi:RecA-family ATPase
MGARGPDPDLWAAAAARATGRPSVELSFRDLAMRLFDNGYHVVPIAPKGFRYESEGKTVEAGGKGPIEPGWQAFGERQTADDVRRLIAGRPGWGVGIMHALTPGIDIDVMLEAASREIHALAVDTFGELLVRFGRAPRRMLVGRCEAPFARVKSADYRMPGDEAGDKPHSVEVRCDRQQFVAFGTHPDTRRPYFWEGPTPLEARLEDLPPIDAGRAVRFIAEAEAILLSHGGVRCKTLRERGDAAPKSAAELRARDPALAREWFRAIPNADLSRDDWVYMAHAVKGALGEGGFDDFLEFSRKSAKHHSEETVHRLWNSIEVREIGAGTLRFLAEHHGWRPGPRKSLQIIDPRSFLGLEIPAREWIVPDWVPCGVATALYGPGGYGKSLLAMQLMTACALGRPWLGLPAAKVRSLGVFCEDDVDELRRRQAAINRTLYNVDLDALGDIRWPSRVGEDNLLMVFNRSGRAELTPLFGLLREAALDLGARQIVIDTIADTFGGNQNDMGQVRQYVMFGLTRLAMDIGGGVVACAHPSRSGISSGTGESGSVQWDATFRSRLYLSAPEKEKDDDGPEDPDARVLTRKKANYATRDEAIDLRWHDGVLRVDGSTAEGECPDAETVFLSLLDKTTAERQPVSHNSRAGNCAPKVFALRPERRGYRRADFERAMQRLFSMNSIGIAEYQRSGHSHEKIVRNEPPPF